MASTTQPRYRGGERAERVRSSAYHRQDVDAMKRRSPTGTKKPPPVTVPARRVEPGVSSNRPQPESRSRRQGKAPARPTGGTPRNAPQIVSGGKYQNIILAEFIGTLLLTVLTPVAKNSAKQGLSPYAGADMVKLASMVLLFFLLALVSSAGPAAARLCAWLGGLVLIADGLYEAANISKDFDLFTGLLNKAANPGASQS